MARIAGVDLPPKKRAEIGLTYKVELEKSRAIVVAHLAGQVSGERNFIRLLPGDRVEVDVSPHDLTRGRIVRKIES